MKVILFTFETILSFLEHFPVQLYPFRDSETKPADCFSLSLSSSYYST